MLISIQHRVGGWTDRRYAHMDTHQTPTTATQASSGTMKGTVTAYRGIDNSIIEAFTFDTKIVERYDGQGLGLGIVGSITVPRRADISLRFLEDYQPTGNFSFPTQAIKSLVYIDGIAVPTFAAISGTVVFENHDASGRRSVNGKLEFRTENIANKYFIVDALFVIEGMTPG